MAYKPPKQTIVDNDLNYVPSNEAVFEALKLKLDEPTVSGTNGQLLQLTGYVGGEATTSWVNPPSPLPSQSGNANKILITDGTNVSWQYPGIYTFGTYYAGTIVLGRSVPTSFSGDPVSSATDNIIIGNLAGNSITFARNNVFIGTSAGQAFTTGGINRGNSVGIGYQALSNTTGGSYGQFTAIGFQALQQPTGHSSTALGFQAGRLAQGERNTFVGALAGSNGAGGQYITAVGSDALKNNTASSNTAVGSFAGEAVTSGSGNLLLGYTAGNAITTGSNNTIIGTVAGTTTLSDTIILAAGTTERMRVGANVIVGRAQPTNLTGAVNVIIGTGNSGSSLTTGSSNIIIGQNTNTTLTTGSGNVSIGFNVGNFPTNAVNNVAIGAYTAELNQTTTARAVAIGGAAARFGSVTNSVIVGTDAGSNGALNSVIIGDEANSNTTGSLNSNVIVLGKQASSDNLLNLFTVGSTTYPMTRVYIGKGARGITSKQLVSSSLRSGRTTGSDQVGVSGPLLLTGTTGTGNGVGSDVIIATATAGSQGTAENSIVDRVIVDTNGNLGINTPFPMDKLAVKGNIKAYDGDLIVSSTGKGLKIATGTNATAGLATITNGTSEVTVTTAAAATNSIILVTNQTSTAYVSVTTKTNGSFKIAHANNVGSDQEIAWMIINPLLQDSDVATFISSVGSTNLTDLEKNAIENLVTDFKAYGLWSKMKAVYPFVGGTAAAHKWNLKNPVDSDAAFRLVFNGTWTHDSSGATSLNNTSYIETYFVPSVQFSAITNFHVGYYQSKFSLSYPEHVLGAGETTRIRLGHQIGSHTLWGTVNATTFGSGNGPNENFASQYRGLLLLNSTQTGRLYFPYFNFSLPSFNPPVVGDDRKTFTLTAESAAALTGNLPTESLHISGYNNAGVHVNGNTIKTSFISFGDGLTAQEAINYNKAVEKFQDTLNRRNV